MQRTFEQHIVVADFRYRDLLYLKVLGLPASRSSDTGRTGTLERHTALYQRAFIVPSGIVEDIEISKTYGWLEWERKCWVHRPKGNLYPLSAPHVPDLHDAGLQPTI